MLSLQVVIPKLFTHLKPLQTWGPHNLTGSALIPAALEHPLETPFWAGSWIVSANTDHITLIETT